ncbi:MAG: ribosome-associated translation inhibitor RaiA [Bacteroidales bacterium]|jgi:putative sigma-54 modulation protein|nr:ribosome-associated translation inhibitor RaiA [Bacteroidales bacterium]MCR5551018.1 ribosome-associated translation inhibitor RaiA [Bacteroidales bacterium]
MTINISSVHFKTDQKLEEFINEKVEKLNKIHEGIIGADVTLKLENTEAPENKTADIRIKIRGNDAIASKTAKSFEEATDLAVDALKKQLSKIKEKEQSKR